VPQAFITRQVRSAIPGLSVPASNSVSFLSLEHKMEATPVWSGEGGCGVSLAWMP
jgi:hypothetical protein